ncbi:MAG: hypothetical protein LLF99_06785 [Desulfobacteraceae bacterium]|nr:hypothetical protein [Desulfobacteraceae bacterium]
MAINLYVLSQRAVVVLHADGTRETVHYLQLAVEQALSIDSRKLVDAAIRHAGRLWKGTGEFPSLVVQVGPDGLPATGSPIYRWQFHRRPFCFDHELPLPEGYLGERDLLGFRFRSTGEQAHIRDFETARGIDKGSTTVYKDFWRGKIFESGEEFLRYRRRIPKSPTDRRSSCGGLSSAPPRLRKILDLIGFIESKGNRASAADLHFLGCLKDKATQLGRVSKSG